MRLLLYFTRRITPALRKPDQMRIEALGIAEHSVAKLATHRVLRIHPQVAKLTSARHYRSPASPAKFGWISRRKNEPFDAAFCNPTQVSYGTPAYR